MFHIMLSCYYFKPVSGLRNTYKRPSMRDSSMLISNPFVVLIEPLIKPC